MSKEEMTHQPAGWLERHPDGRTRIVVPGRFYDSDARWVRTAALYEHPMDLPADAFAAARLMSNVSHQDFIRGVQWAMRRAGAEPAN